MPETNFLTSIQEQENNQPAGGKKPRKKRQKKVLKTPAKAPVAEERTVKPAFKLKDNLNLKPAMAKAKFKIEENFSGAKKGEAKNIYPVNPVRNKFLSGANGVYRKIAFSFVALTIILVFAVLYFGFFKVTLVIVPNQEKITDSLSLLVVDKTVDIDSPEQNQISGIVRQSPAEQARIFASSGKEILGEEVRGRVVIINNYMKNQPLVATTRLLSQSNKLFRLKNTVNVPAGGQVEAEVYADEPKPDMAIGPSKFTIPGLWAGIQDKIYAESREPMKYSEKIKYIIKQSDIDNAISELKKDLLVSAKKEIALAYSEYDQSILQADNNSVKLETLGKVGEEKENFTVKMKTMVTMVAFKGNDVYKQAEQKLAAALADDREIVGLSRPDMTYALGNFNLSQATASVNINFSAKVTLKDTSGIIKKNNLAGLNVEQVRAYLNRLPEVAGYEIKFFPSFIKKMPNLVDRIEIVIKK